MCLDQKKATEVALCQSADLAFKRTGSFCLLPLKSQLPRCRRAVHCEVMVEGDLEDDRPS